MQIARQPVSTKNANPKECDTHRTKSLRYREMAYLLVPNASSKKTLSIQKIHPAVYGAQNEAYKCQLIGKASNNLCLS